MAELTHRTKIPELKYLPDVPPSQALEKGSPLGGVDQRHNVGSGTKVPEPLRPGHLPFMGGRPSGRGDGSNGAELPVPAAKTLLFRLTRPSLFAVLTETIGPKALKTH